MTKSRYFGGWRVFHAFLLFAGLIIAQPVLAFYNSHSPMGTNTNEILDYDASVPFINLMKMSLPFQEAHQINKGSIRYDRNGYPNFISRGGQVGTRFISQLPVGSIPAGYYTVLYDGEGKMEYRNDASLHKKVGPGKDIIKLEAGSDNAYTATLYILETNPNNHIRNIRILPTGGICRSNPFQRVSNPSQCSGDFMAFEQHADTIIFNPDYLRYMRDFRVIRFMNMSGITRNPVYAWEDRASIDQVSWGGVEGIRGAPIEVMVELANRLHADPWFSMPHAASDDFIRRFAEYVRAHLHPTLKVYVEYTNEAWNGIFTQHQYVKQQGLRLKLDSNPTEAAYKFYAKRSVDVFRIWEQTFRGKERLVRVLSGLVSSTQMTESIIKYNDAFRDADAYAVAPYVYGDYDALRQARSVSQIFQIMTDPKYPHSLQGELASVRKQVELTRRFGLDLIAYEGGQHLVDYKSKSDTQRHNELFYQANRHPRMASIYKQLLEGWKQAGGKLFVHFTSPRIYNKFGSFGTKEHINQPDSQAPKHQAIKQFVSANRCWWEGCAGNTLVRHTKPASSLDALKAQSRPLDETAPSRDMAAGTPPQQPPVMGNMDVSDDGRVYQRILVSMQQSPNNQYAGGGAAIARQVRSNSNVWQGGSTYQLRSVVSGEVGGAKDLAALWQAAWDQNNLYIRVGVEDDHPYVSDSTVPWHDDAIEIYVDADGSGGRQYDGRHDFHFIFNLKDNKVALGKKSPAIGSMPMNHRVTRAKEGYVLELTVPWSAMRVQPRAGQRIGLDVHVNDDDNGGDRDGKLTWHARQDEAWRNPAMLGEVVLGN